MGKASTLSARWPRTDHRRRGVRSGVEPGSIDLVTDATRDLLNRALDLPPGERVKLAHELLGSVVEDEEVEGALDDLEPEFLAELNRRAGDDRPGIPAGEAFAEVERRLAERRRARDQAG